MSRERKTIRCEIKQAGDDGSFEATIATIGVVDSDGDVVEAGALAGKTCSIVPAHQQHTVPLGKVKIEERGDEVVAVGMFNMEIPAAKDWHAALKFDLSHQPSVQEWSWGYMPKASRDETRNGERVRILEDVDLWEVSPVLRGASVGSRTIAVKALHKADGMSDNDRRELLERALTDVEKGAESLWVEAVFEDAVVYTARMPEEPGKLYQVGYSMDGEAVKITDDRAEVIRDVSYVPAKDGNGSGLKVTDEVRMAAAGVHAALIRVRDVHAMRQKDGRAINATVRAEAISMAAMLGEVVGLAKGLAALVDEIKPDDAVSKAVSTWAAYEAGLTAVLE